MIDHKATALHVQDFHAGARTVDKYINVSILDVTTHQIGHHTTEGIKTPAHICRKGIQIISHGRCETEHPTDVVKATAYATSPDPAYR